MSNNRLINEAGILAFNTWRYYVANFGCSHFKGRGLEENFYLLKPIYLENGERVRNRATFQQALEEGVIRDGIDYILYDHQAAVATAKYIYHTEFIEDADFHFINQYVDRDVRLRIYGLQDHIAERAKTLQDQRVGQEFHITYFLLS
jgi:hypothetical protein